MMQSYKKIQVRQEAQSLAQEQQDLVSIGIATLGMLTVGGMVAGVIMLAAVILVQLGRLL